MAKKFDYHGINLQELEKMPMEKLFQMFPSRARRSLTRGINEGKRKLIEEITYIDLNFYQEVTEKLKQKREQ